MPNNEYHIYVHIDGEDGGGSGGGGGGVIDPKRKKTVKKVVGLRKIGQIANNVISYEISQVSIRTGAIQYQQRLKQVYGLARSTVQYGVMIGLGIGTGNLPLAIAGVALDLGNKVVTEVESYATKQREKGLESISLDMQNIRAGTYGRRSDRQ